MLDVFFEPTYGQLYEHVEKAECCFFSHENATGAISNMYLMRPVPWLVDGIQYYDTVTPYGYGGPIITKGSASAELIDGYYQAWQAHCIRSGIIADFVRFHLFDNISLRENFPGDLTHASDNVVRWISADMDEIWMQFEHKVRKNVKKAKSNNLEILMDTAGKYLDAFLDIYYGTMERDHAKKYYYFERRYFQQIIESLPGRYIFFHVILDDKIISTELVLYSEKYAYSFLGGTLDEFYPLRPNDLLKYEIIKWCKEKGIKAFVLGGGHNGKDGIYRYKKSFAPESDYPFYVGRTIYQTDIYDKLVEIRKSIAPLKEEYFPLYRG